jgi:4-carboxymuconolactone decarboxylase
MELAASQALRSADEGVRMTRLSYVEPARLTPEQKDLYDSIASGPRAAKRKSLVDSDGHLTGPFNAFLHLPALGTHWSAIGEALRFRTTLDRRLFELAILVVAVHWRSGHEWAAHARLAREAGISEDVVTALKAGVPPVFAQADEETVFRFVHELVTERRVRQTSYDALVALLGETQTVELANAIGYYVALAAMLNAFDVHPPAGLEDPWPAGEHAA